LASLSKRIIGGDIMKVAIILGRGVEGCGVTRCAIEFQRAHPGTKIFATLDKKWGRRNGMDFECDEFIAADWSQCERVIKEINENFDLFVVHSIPSKDHPEECADNFVKILDEVKIKKAMIHVDHSVKSLHNNARLEDICNRVDVIMTHSDTGVFAKWLKKIRNTTRFTTMGLGFNYDATRAQYWKPIELQDSKRLRWIGRSARWKGPDIILDFHQEELRSSGFCTILEGLEASIAYATVLYYDNHEKQKPRDVINKFRVRPEFNENNKFTHGEEIYGGPAYCYPQYVNVECMERMSLSAFGSDLYHLNPEQYGDNIENCHAECIATGTVPIFHKHFGDNIIHKVTGDPCTKSNKSGTIWLDRDNFASAGELVKKLSADLILRDEWREMAFEFWKQHSDSKIIVTDILSKIEKDERSTLDSFFA